MPADLYYEINGATHGPITVAQLKQLADDGVLKPSTLVWRAGMHKRVPASTIRGLFNDDDPITATVVEEEDPAKDRAAKKSSQPREREEEEEPEESELLAEVPVIYREGLPGIEGPLEATLCVESTRLRFVFDAEDMEEFPISFEKVENIMEPSRGDFPAAMKKKALAAKVGGKVGKLAAGMFGQMIGGDAGALVEKVGDGASGMAERSGDLGKLPRNRIILIARLRKQRRKVRFDANGDSREDMNEEARALYRQIRKARDGFAAANGVESADYEEVGEEEPVPLSESEEQEDTGAAHLVAPAPSASPESGKAFRVMRGASVRGPYSLEELRKLSAAGKLLPTDMIGVETWLPFGTLCGMIVAGAKAGGASAAPSGGMPLSESGAIPVDEEFRL
jgi:hypothetical protein